MQDSDSGDETQSWHSKSVPHGGDFSCDVPLMDMDLDHLLHELLYDNEAGLLGDEPLSSKRGRDGQPVAKVSSRLSQRFGMRS
jgi:hypothetical protein